MTDEEFEEHLRMVKYFFREKGDVRRYASWGAFEPVLKQRRPDIYLIIRNYFEAEEALSSWMSNGC